MRALRLVPLLAVLAFLPAWVLAAEFSARHVTRMDNQEIQGKIYYQGQKIRQEFMTKDGGSINIARPDKQQVYLLMPAQKMCVELPFDKEALAKTMQMPQDRKDLKLVGTETVNGYETEKYEGVEQDNGKSMKYYVWVAKKLGGPIKWSSADGRFSSELRDIKEGNVPDSVFEIPPGYQKMPAPAGLPPGGLGGGR